MAILCLFAIHFTAQAQELTYEIPLDTQVHASTQIVEGKVISKKSFWDANRQNIYTVNTIEVYKVFKGDALNTIEVITAGGTVDLDHEVVTPSLQLDVKDTGIFTLENSTIDVPVNHAAFNAYSDAQGFYKYNILNNTVINPYHVKQNITDFYDEVVGLTNKAYDVIAEFDVNEIMNTALANRGTMSITSISPTTATAGTKTVLTINGSGFGATPLNVGFANANDGGATFTGALATQILTWSDTQITVEIPSRAGNGGIAIINDTFTAVLATSAQALSIEYAHINAVSDAITPDVDIAYIVQHVNDNTAGGYTWQMFTDFDADADANASFIRALDTWRCETGVNWTIGAVTTTDVVASDGINIVRMDNGAELPSGVLGRCTSRFSGCFISGGTDLQWYVSELDIAFDDGTNWEFGPGAPGGTEFDFESVAVHELGHGHQLAHVIDSSVIMHYAIGPGTSNRTLSMGDIDGAGNMQTRSTTTTACTQTSMTNFDCAILSVSSEELSAAISIYPNPTKGRMFINNDSFIEIDSAQIYDVNGRLVKDIKLNNAQMHVINLNNVSKGVYFITINSGSTSFTEKIIIE